MNYGFRKKAGFYQICLGFWVLCHLWAVWPWADVSSSLSLFPHLSKSNANDTHVEGSVWGWGEPECDKVPCKWPSVIWMWVVWSISLSSSESLGSLRKQCSSENSLYLSGQMTNLKCWTVSSQWLDTNLSWSEVGKSTYGNISPCRTHIYAQEHMSRIFHCQLWWNIVTNLNATNRREAK